MESTSLTSAYGLLPPVGAAADVSRGAAVPLSPIKPQPPHGPKVRGAFPQSGRWTCCRRPPLQCGHTENATRHVLAGVDRPPPPQRNGDPVVWAMPGPYADGGRSRLPSPPMQHPLPPPSPPPNTNTAFMRRRSAPLSPVRDRTVRVCAESRGPPAVPAAPAAGPCSGPRPPRKAGQVPEGGGGVAAPAVRTARQSVCGGVRIRDPLWHVGAQPHRVPASKAPGPCPATRRRAQEARALQDRGARAAPSRACVLLPPRAPPSVPQSVEAAPRPCVVSHATAALNTMPPPPPRRKIMPRKRFATGILLPRPKQ